MCYYISIIKSKVELEMRFDVKLPDNISPKYKISAFDKEPKILSILNESPDRADFYLWGLIPRWIKNQKDAEKIRLKTVNARAETIFEKVSYKESILKRRALIIADGFFEWHDENGIKIPYHIKFKDGRAFAMAAIWDEWKNPANGKTIKSLSLLTYKANSLLSEIHNTKKRMPIILPEEIEKEWIRENLSPQDIKNYFKVYEYKDLTAYPVSKSDFIK